MKCSRAWLMSRSQRRSELVEHGAVDARPRELLERRALGRVVALDRLDQRLQAAGDEVLDLAARRDLAHLLVDDVLDHRGEREHEPVADAAIARVAVLLPQCECLVGRDPAPRALRIELHLSASLRR
jgi:hypothetical protein